MAKTSKTNYVLWMLPVSVNRCDINLDAWWPVMPDVYYMEENVRP